MKTIWTVQKFLVTIVFPGKHKLGRTEDRVWWEGPRSTLCFWQRGRVELLSCQRRSCETLWSARVLHLLVAHWTQIRSDISAILRLMWLQDISDPARESEPCLWPCLLSPLCIWSSFSQQVIFLQFPASYPVSVKRNPMNDWCSLVLLFLRCCFALQRLEEKNRKVYDYLWRIKTGWVHGPVQGSSPIKWGIMHGGRVPVMEYRWGNPSHV